MHCKEGGGELHHQKGIYGNEININKGAALKVDGYKGKQEYKSTRLNGREQRWRSKLQHGHGPEVAA